MISTEEMLDKIIQDNTEFNQVLDANQKGYVVRYIETNNIAQYESFPGFKIISSDDLFTKIRVFLRTDPLIKTRLEEKPRDTDRTHFMQISYKNGLGGMVINMNEVPEKQLKKILNAVQKVR